MSDLQNRVAPWMQECFGPVISADTQERNWRFIEEAMELVQSCGCTLEDVIKQAEYTFSRPIGEPRQEVGGVMITLAALCLANNLNMHKAGEIELARINEPGFTVKLREKQATKPLNSPLPASQEDKTDG